jgi:ATP-binding cassette subfamily B (MDR/TAP) protein 1
VFDKVDFKYEKPLFKNFSLEIEPGITALIGESGGGKTTIINLIMRFYDIFEGRVYLMANNHQYNINTLTFKSLRERVGYVGQEPVLIGKTIKEALTAEDEPEESIIALLKKVNAWDFVKGIGLNNTYAALSGGQKQRIAIARALIRKPEILILDEGTSALDRTNENEVLHAIRNLNIPFVIMIAHRMETVISADRIVKLEKGKLVAQGTYGELVARGVMRQLDVNREEEDTIVEAEKEKKDKKEKEERQ